MREWAYYERIAGAYDSVAAPHYFEAPAATLVTRLGISRADRVLDLGSGTGVVAEAALRKTAYVVATDASGAMLLKARRRGVVRCVASALPSIAFANGSFDCVAASFLLNHLADLNAGLREIRRVLRPGGRLGATSWARGPAQNEAGAVWTELAEEFVDGSRIDSEVHQALPGEQLLSGPDALARALSDSGLEVSSSEEVAFLVSIATADYIRSRSIALSARFMQSVLSSAEWDRFLSTVSERLADRFGPRLEFTVRVNFAVGTAPAA
jgi:SAM-dependent methyltransferase